MEFLSINTYKAEASELLDQAIAEVPAENDYTAGYVEGLSDAKTLIQRL